MGQLIRWPAEFEEQRAVWVCSPHNRDTWPGCFNQAEQQHADWVALMRSAGVTVRDLKEEGIATDDSWCRDYLPIIVEERAEKKPTLILPHADVQRSEASGIARRVAQQFVFNGWGGKYGPQPRDADAGRRMIDLINADADAEERSDKASGTRRADTSRLAKPDVIDFRRHDLILEGGSIETDGRGTVITTEQCLLNPNRPGPNGRPRSRSYMEEALADTLGARHVVWLPGGIEGDDTDGHIDDVARFLAPGVVACIDAPPDHPDHAVTAANLAALRQARDADGEKLSVLSLPVPEPIFHEFPAEPATEHSPARPAERRPVPASYANFLLFNRRIFVPVFGQRADDLALRLIDDALDGYAVHPVRAESLVVGLGALHCLSMQQPA